jgi:predicted metal-dependent HD superfamily phosphohydrolase
MNGKKGSQMMRSRWLRFFESVIAEERPGAGVVEQVFKELDRCYREEHRHYHNWAHIAACLGELDSSRSLASHPAAVELALWFHDAVYVPGAPDNEQRSADMLGNASRRLGLAEATAREAQELILETRYGGAGESSEGASALPRRQDRSLIRDIDLSILGKPPAEFDRYERAIQREYSVIPAAERWKRRITVLEGFLVLPRIYETGHFRKRYERQARRNLNLSISRLRGLSAG